VCQRVTGEYNTGERIKFKASDIVYLVGWLLFFAMARMYDIPVLIGTFFTGSDKINESSQT